MDYVVKQVQRLNGRKILLTGNNDTCDNAFYKKCGFEDIFRRDRIVTDKHVFSHFPVNMRDSTRINQHGHIHGSFVYYECDPENHIDAYWKLWNGPMRISELDKLYKEGKYKGRKEIAKPDNWDEVISKWKVREITATKAMEELGLKRTTFYKLLKESNCS